MPLSRTNIIMRTLFKKRLLQLFEVIETNGRYKLELIDPPNDSATFRESKIARHFNYLMGRDLRFEVTNESCDIGCSCGYPNGTLTIQAGNDKLIIDDLRKRIDIDFEKEPRFFVTVNKERSEIRWYVAQEKGHFYSDSD